MILGAFAMIRGAAHFINDRNKGILGWWIAWAYTGKVRTTTQDRNTSIRTQISNLKIITSAWSIVWIIVVIIVVSFVILMPLRGQDLLPDPGDQKYNTAVNKTISIHLINEALINKTGISFIVKHQHPEMGNLTTTPKAVNYKALKSGNDNFTFRYAFNVSKPYPILPYLVPYFVHNITVFTHTNQTTITSVTDGNRKQIQKNGSTVSTSITFQVTAARGTNPIAGFECSLDGSLFWSCATTSPATISYNNRSLAAGQQHTFEVRAMDTQGNVDSAPASFTWTILTPNQAVQKLINTINSFNLPKGVTTSLEAPLNAAITQLSHNHNAAACTQLNNFLNQVSTKQTNRELTSQQAADLRQQTAAIQSAIGCSNTASSSPPSLLPLPMP
jgi:hypothetical protein